MLGDVSKLFAFKSLLTTPSNVLPLHHKQTFPPIISIFNESEGDGIESRLPFKIFSTLNVTLAKKCLLFCLVPTPAPSRLEELESDLKDRDEEIKILKEQSSQIKPVNG